MTMSFLTIRGVERRFASATGSTLALQATDLDVAENDFITIGVIGLVSDLAFKRANRAMFRWAAL